MSARIKLIAIDLDGTLLNGEGRVSAAVRQAVRRAVDMGVHVVVASGRHHSGCVDVATELGGADYVISQHGALVKRLEGHETVCNTLIAGEDAIEIARTLREEGFEPFIGVDGYSRGVEYLFYGGEPRQESTKELFAEEHFLETLAPGEAMPYDGATQVGALASRERCREGEEMLRRRFGERFVYMVLKSPRYRSTFLDVISPGAGKGKALLALAERLNIRPGETAAVGDDINDLDMLDAAGVGVAMGNASARVKAAADIVVASNEADGAAEAIEMLLAGRVA